MNKKLIVAAMAPFALAACMGTGEGPQKTSANAMPEISADRIKAHMTFLADDAMMGRNTGSKEYTIAANYVATQYKLMGLKPMGDNGSYFQTVNFAQYMLDGDKSAMSMMAGGKMTNLSFGTDYIYIPSVSHPNRAVKADEVVFVGYGTAAEVKGMDLSGKVVAYLSGKRSAVDGAKASIILRNDAREKRSPYARVAAYYKNSGSSMMNPEGKPMGGRGVEGAHVSAILNNKVSQSFAKAAGMDLEAMTKMADAKGFKPTSMKVSVDLAAVTKIGKSVNSPNVVAVMEGSDPKLKDEYVIISAHLDHVGAGEANCHKRANDTSKKGDVICNGAMDNASGISTMLEAANAFTKGKAPRRSVMFIALTAEEKGLLGAKYFTEYPTVPLKQIAADVNLDMPILTYNFADVVAFGGEHSTIGEKAAKALAKIGVGLAEDPMPEQNLFRRSDHYMFVLKGVPSVFLMSGPNEVGQPAGEGLKKFKKFLNTNYHSPADDLSQPLLWDVAAKFSLAKYLIISEIANADDRPLWYEGNEYGDKYAPNAPKAPKKAMK